MSAQDTALILREIEGRLPQTRVLIIDRTLHARAALCKMLNELGITQITQANTAAEALKLAQAQPFDLFLSEHHLEEGADGHQLLETFRQRDLVTRTAVYFVVTSERSAAQVMSIAELIPDDYLIKPFNTAQLQDRLLQAMYRKQHVLRDVYIALDQHDYQSAVDACNRISGEFPAFHLHILRIKGELLNTLGLHSAAELLYSEVIREKPLPWARRGLAQALYERGRLEESAKLVSSLIQDNPDYLASYDFLARILDLQGQASAAQTLLQRAAEKSPLNVERHRIVGEFAARNSDWPAATRAFSKVLERKRGTVLSRADDYSNLALVMLEQGNTEGAHRLAESLRRELREDPLMTLVSPLIEGLCAQAEGKATDARNKVAEALAAHEKLTQDRNINLISPRMTCDMAHACMLVGETDAAQTLLRRVAAVHHDAPQTIARVKSVFVRHKQTEAGQKMMSQVNQDIIDLNNRGVQAAQSGNLRQSVQMLVDTAEQVPNLQFQVNAAKAIFALLSIEGWNPNLAERGLHYLRRAWAQDKSSSKVSSARAQYVQTATRFGQPVQPL